MKLVNETIEKIYGKYPEKILQFGEGNFLRAFADWMINMANKDGLFQGSIVVCQPIAAGLAETINVQDGVYTLAMRGMESGKATEKIEQITSISRCIDPYKNYN
jgi:tagaturonate reductase